MTNNEEQQLVDIISAITAKVEETIKNVEAARVEINRNLASIKEKKEQTRRMLNDSAEGEREIERWIEKLR